MKKSIKLTKKDGHLTSMHLEAFKKITSSKDGKVYPRSWTRSGHRANLRSIEVYVMDFAKHFGFKVTTGNDAPRGGEEGFYIKFSSRAIDRIISEFQ